MQRQKRENTGPEQLVRGILRDLGLRYRLFAADLPGRPDVANRRWRWAVFVHGCYWHHHEGCRYATIPRKNREFWLDKFARNRRRDTEKAAALVELGYHVVVVWECETYQPDTLRLRLAGLLAPGAPVPPI